MNVVSAITGLPYVGKTTLFNLLTGAHASTGAFAGAEAETNVGVAKVPDRRVGQLAALYKPKKITHAEVMYRDIGLARAEKPGQAISPQKLGDLRTADAIVHVVRAFSAPSVPHVDGSVDPVRDLSTVERTEFRQFGNQGPGDCLSDAGHGSEEILFLDPDGRSADLIVNQAVQLREFFLQRLA